jgi:hypothetical protein
MANARISIATSGSHVGLDLELDGYLVATLDLLGDQEVKKALVYWALFNEPQHIQALSSEQQRILLTLWDEQVTAYFLEEDGDGDEWAILKHVTYKRLLEVIYPD